LKLVNAPFASMPWNLFHRSPTASAVKIRFATPSENPGNVQHLALARHSMSRAAPSFAISSNLRRGAAQAPKSIPSGKNPCKTSTLHPVADEVTSGCSQPFPQHPVPAFRVRIEDTIPSGQLFRRHPVLISQPANFFYPLAAAHFTRHLRTHLFVQPPLLL